MEISFAIIISCSYNYNWLLDMLDNGKLITANASEVVQKNSTD